MGTLSTGRTLLIFFSSVCLAVGGLSCRKSQVAEKKEMLSLRLEHTPVDEHIGPGGQEIRVKVVSSLDLKEGEPKVFYRKKEGDFSAIAMTLSGEEDEYVATIPHHPKGTTVLYYIRASAVTGAAVTLPKDAVSKEESYALTFKDSASPILFALYLGCMLVGLFLLLVAGYWALLFLRRGEKLAALAKAALGGTILVFLGGIPFAVAVHYQIYGALWGNIPRGMAMTDVRVIPLIVLWVGTLVVFRGTLFQNDEGKNVVSDKTFASLVLGMAIVTAIVFLAPK